MNDERKQRARSSESTGDRLPPHSTEAEAGVLGCCLLEPANCIGDAAELLTEAEAFYDMRHQVIWEHLRKLENERGVRSAECGSGEPGGQGASVFAGVDVITLQQSLRDAGRLEQVGGVEYLMSLPDQVPSAVQLPAYLEIVREKWLLRRMVKASAENIADVYESEDSVQDVLARAERRIMSASEARLPSQAVPFRDVILDVQEHVLDKFRRGHKRKIGPATGFNFLDNILPGLGAGQLIVLAARPRTGKSAWIMQVAEQVTIKEKTPAAVFSLEMSARSLGTRAIFQRAGADITKFLNGFMIEDEVRKLTAAGVALGGAKLFVDETARMSIEDLEIKARRLKRQHGVRVLFVDYFQLMFCRQAKRQWSKSDELAEVSMRLKALAKELSLAIVLCAQMNREIEKETHRRPRLADLKDTGQLEQDADVVMFLWKPDINLENPRVRERMEQLVDRVPCPADWKTWDKNDDGKTWKHYLQLITCTVEKQREGRSGEDAALMFIKPWTRFVDGYRPQVVKEQQPQQDEFHGEPEELIERGARDGNEL